MLNWLNRQNSTAAAAAGFPQPPLADWRNREQSDDGRSRTLEPAQTVPRKRRWRLLELFSFAVVIALIVGVDLYIFGINKRLSVLESQFVDVKEWAFPASLLEGKYASLNARVRALTDAFSGLNEKLTAVAAQQQPVSVAARTPGDDAASVVETEAPAAPGTTENTTLAMAETDPLYEAPAAGVTGTTAGSASASAKTSGLVRRAEPEVPPAPPASEPAPPEADSARSPNDAKPVLPPEKQQPALPSSGEPAIALHPAPATDTQPPANRKSGPWVINLLSDPNEALAARFADRARERGVPVEQNRTEVKGRAYWRVQITGFETASEARARAQEVKKKLDLEDVWVFRQAG